MNETIIEIVKSWADTKGNVNTMEDILAWIEGHNQDTYVNIKECSINESAFWFYDDHCGEVLNRKRSFFSIKGMRRFEENKFVREQPMIFQPEIGYLGIICKPFDGVMNFLMQAKIEPGNVNCVQISPTLQATRSNFTRVHGGRFPTYLEYFEQLSRHHVIYDQIQSEQSERFNKKRNRNIILEVSEEVVVYPDYKWMTLGQIKKLMEVNNLVNMDTRTVLSGIPIASCRFSQKELAYIENLFTDSAFFHSMCLSISADYLSQMYGKINNYKMFRNIRTAEIGINQMIDWEIDEYGITCLKPYNFSVRYYDIEISGREVQHWIQPLFKATGKAVFGLISCRKKGSVRYLVTVKSEMGNFDMVEIGPSVQLEPVLDTHSQDKIQELFLKNLETKKGVYFDALLSEEGGRFYQEQNRNVLMEVAEEEIGELPSGYMWTEYGALNYLVQVNNCLNIQLRNLLSLLKI